MFVYPEIDPIIFSIGFIKIRWYGLMYVIGFLFAWWLARRRCQRPLLMKGDILRIVLRTYHKYSD